MNKQSPDRLDRVKTSQYRGCHYEPKEDLIRLTQEVGGAKSETLYLEVRNRVLWFNEYLHETKQNGYIDDSEIRFIPEANMLVATATVYINGEIAGRASVGRTPDPNDHQLVASMCTQAKGRALSNAGFGTVDCGVPENAPLAEAPVPAGNGAGLDAPESGDTSVDAPKKRGRKPKAEHPPVEPADTPATVATGITTLEEALNYQMPFGPYKGQTMGMLRVQNPNTLQFYASDEFSNDRYPEIQQAAKIICSQPDFPE